MKLSDVTNAYTALSQIAGLKMPASGSYKIAKNIRKLEPEFQSFEDARKNIIKDYFVDVDGVPTLEPANQAVVDAEFKALMETEVSVEPHMIKLADFGTAEPTPAQLLAIYFMLEE